VTAAKYLNMPFLEAVQDMVERSPVMVEDWRVLAQRYSEEKVFGLVRSLSMQRTKEVQGAIIEAIREGLPKEAVEDFVQKRVKKSTKQYAETVFRTNLNTAFNEGRARQAKENSGIVAGLEFIATGGHKKTGLGTGWGDGSTREKHAKVDGLRAPTNSPMWQIFFPPLGYNCRCSIREITRTEAESKNWLDGTGLLLPWHPTFKYEVTVSSLIQYGAGPDIPQFGRMVS